MKTQDVSIKGIPAILWGDAANRMMIAVHGDQSNKADRVIAILAEEAVEKGYQVLSFDLPEHGDRISEPRLCTVENCIEDLGEVMYFARTRSNQISLFGCSIGAYFSMMAYKDEPIPQALFLSPIVDMKRIIDNMMNWYHISEERLKNEGEIITPAKTLYWDYYKYVVENPVQWDKPTAVLYGKNDNVSEFCAINSFVERTQGELTVLDKGEHYFHTNEQLSIFRRWLHENVAAGLTVL